MRMPLGVAAAWKFQALLNRDHTRETAPATVLMKVVASANTPPLGGSSTT